MPAMQAPAGVALQEQHQTLLLTAAQQLSQRPAAEVPQQLSSWLQLLLQPLKLQLLLLQQCLQVLTLAVAQALLQGGPR